MATDGEVRLPDAPTTRARLLAAALACVERDGIEATSLEDVANEAGLSRATVYRHFPGGREQLITETVAAQVRDFLDQLGRAVADEADLAAQLRVGLVEGHRLIREHALLQRVLRTEPEALLRELVEAEPVLVGVLRSHLRDQLAGEDLVEGTDLDEAADHLTRLFTSFLGSPGRWRLDDPREVDRLVRTQLLAGMVSST